MQSNNKNCKRRLLEHLPLRDAFTMIHRQNFNHKGKTAWPTLLTILAIIPFVISCTSAKKATQASSLETKIVENPDLFRSLSLNATSVQDRGIFSPLAGTATSLARNAISGFLERERTRTTLSHFDARSDLYFYDTLSDLHPLDPTGIRFDGLDIIRWMPGEGGSRDTAFYASLELDQSNPNELLNNAVFRLRLVDLKINASEVPDSRRWYKPWSWFQKQKDTLNLSLGITILASWIDDSMQVHSGVPIGRFEVSLENVPLKGADGREEFFRHVHEIPVSGYSYLVPRSAGFAYDQNHNLVKRYGQGRFSVEIELFESRVNRLTADTLVRLKK